MIERIRRLTNSQEIILVLLIGLGLFIYYSLRGLFIISSGPSGKWTYNLNELSTTILLVVETISLLLIGFVLRQRGWKFSDTNFNLSLKAFFHGPLILIFNLLVIGIVSWIITDNSTANTEKLDTIEIETHKNYLIWGLLLVVNSVYEEFIYVGYLFNKVKNKTVFLIFSVFLRTVIHLYQGLFYIVPHIITGLVFGAYYLKYRQLTSLIVAHTLWNLIYLWKGA